MEEKNSAVGLSTGNKKVILLVSKEGQIVEAAGKRKFCLQFNESDILKYEKKMLGESGCPYTLPMHFLSGDGITKAWHDHTGYIQLKEQISKVSCNISERENQRPVCDALDVLSKILKCLREAEDYFILHDRISVNPDTVFVNPESGSVSLAFYPNEAPELTLRERLLAMMDTIGAWYQNEEVDRYIARFQNVIHEKNPGLDGMIRILGTIQRDLNYIYCNSGCLREPATPDDADTGAPTLKRGERTETFRPSGASKFWGGKLKEAPLKLILMQSVFILIPAGLFLSGLLSGTDLAGLAVIAAGVDLWLLKRLRYL